VVESRQTEAPVSREKERCDSTIVVFSCFSCLNLFGFDHKVLTYIEYRAVSGVFRTIDPHPPLPLASVSSPRTKDGGRTHSPGGEGVGVNISEDARHWIGLLQYNPSTVLTHSLECLK
jgi:hypothetical protein